MAEKLIFGFNVSKLGAEQRDVVETLHQNIGPISEELGIDIDTVEIALGAFLDWAGVASITREKVRNLMAGLSTGHVSEQTRIPEDAAEEAFGQALPALRSICNKLQPLM